MRCYELLCASGLFGIGLGACTGFVSGPSDQGAAGPDAWGSSGSSGSSGSAGGSGVAAATRTPLRRLTRAQYNSAVRDILGVTANFSQGFGPDEDAGGFASNITALVSTALVDNYAQTAEKVAAAALANGVASFSPCGAASNECAASFIAAFGRRAFRRPLEQDELARYQTVYDVGRGSNDDFEAGVELVIAAMLQSPYFLYLPELGRPQQAGEVGLALSSHELATRLSFFLLGSTPDAALATAADQGLLDSDEQVASQARRLLGTPAATESLLSFHRQWLQLSDLLSTEKDNATYPDFTPELRQAMNDEVTAFVTSVLRDGDGRLDTLLTSDVSFIRGPLYRLYGLPAPASADVVTRVTLPAGQRAGLLTLPGVLATYGHPDQSSPVARGFLVSDRLLCVTPPAPPPDIDTTVPAPDPSVTTRQRLEQHRKDPTCAACHALMDPYGLTFEHFDGIGRYRSHDGVQPVDSSSTLPDIGLVTDAVDLLKRLARSEAVRACAVKHWFRYANGRVETEGDAATLAAARERFESAEQHIPELLVALATSSGFRRRPSIVP